MSAYLSIDLFKKQMCTLISLLLCSQVIGCSSSELSTFTPYSTGGGVSGGDQGHGGGVSGGDQGHGGGVSGGDQGHGGGVSGGETPPPPPFIPSPPTWTRLTSKQYQNTILDIFGVDVQRNHIEPDTNPHLFYSIGASSTSISSQGVDQYGEVAYFVADTFVQNSARIEADLNCLPEAINDGCVQQLIRTFGGRLYRRPLTEEEANRWLALSSRFAEGQWRRGVATVIAGLLQSPLFLYRREVGEQTQEQEKRRYTSLELASRLSFVILNTTPDDELLNAGIQGELLEDEGLRAQAERLLNTPKAREATQEFFTQYLDLSRLDTVDRDPSLYPQYSPQLIQAMKTEVRLLVDDLVFRQDGDIRRLFSDPRGYVNSALADLYGVSVEGSSLGVFTPVEFTDDIPRAGILSLGAFLTMNAHPTETSPTLRGKYIRERIFCQEVPAPPDDVDLNLERSSENPQTLRQRLEQHRLDPNCNGCHSYIDPPGFLFEHFDSIGQYREEVDGFPIDSSGDLDGQPLNNSLELAHLLREDQRLTRCMVRQLYRYASGRLETVGEYPTLTQIEEGFQSGGYRFKDLMLALVMSDGFRFMSPHPQEQGESP